MKVFIIAALFILIACQKQVKQSQQVRGGVIPDPPSITANIVTLQSRVAANSKKDTDKDGIYDGMDMCPREKETVNGYLDSDGCPDEIPPPPPPPDEPDTDGDGVIDIFDNCPDRPENFNGYRDEDGCPDVPIITLPSMELPASVELITPVPGNQGNEGSCVAFACTYGARSIEQYYRTGATSYDFNTNIFSPEYTFNQASPPTWECASGTAISYVMDIMITQGVCVYNVMPYDDRNGCKVMPDSLQRANASNYKMDGYAIMINTDHNAIKQMIASNHPVIATVLPDNSFINAKAGFVWRTITDGMMPHTLVICGYDDAKNAYKVMNSWGTGWCDGGFGWIDYDLFPTRSSYHVQVIQ